MKSLRFSLLLLLAPALAVAQGLVSDLNVQRTVRLGTTSTGTISPAQITGNQDNYAPTGYATAFRLRIYSDAARTITGLAAGAAGEIKVLTNIGATYTITLADSSGSSTAANQFALAGDYLLQPDGSVMLEYDGTSQRWRVFGLTAAAVSAIYQPIDAALTALAGGSDYVQFTGPTGSVKVFTLPNASSTILTNGVTGATLVTPTLSGGMTATGLSTLDLGSGALPTLINGTQQIRLGQANGSANGIEADAYAATALQLYGRAAGGTRASPSATATGQRFIDILAYGYTNALTASPNGRYRIEAKSNWSASNAEVQHIWSATPSGSTTSVDVMTLDAIGLGIVGNLNATGGAAFGNLIVSRAGNNYLTIKTEPTTGDVAVYTDTSTSSAPVYFGQLPSVGGALGVFSVSVGGAIHANVSTTGLAVAGINANTYSGATGNSIQNSSDTSGSSFVQFNKASSAAIGSITRVTTTDAVVYNTTSDGRLKTNVRDFTAEDSGRIIDALQPRWFDWKPSDLTEEIKTLGLGKDGQLIEKTVARKVTDPARLAKHAADNKSIIGFIAQEEAAVDDALVRAGAVTPGDSDPLTITKQWQRSDAALVPILVAEVKALRARVARLEAAGR